MSLSGPTQVVEEVSRKINGMFLHGALSAVERAVFPDGGGFAFQCIGNTNLKSAGLATMTGASCFGIEGGSRLGL